MEGESPRSIPDALAACLLNAPNLNGDNISVPVFILCECYHRYYLPVDCLRASMFGTPGLGVIKSTRGW